MTKQFNLVEFRFSTFDLPFFRKNCFYFKRHFYSLMFRKNRDQQTITEEKITVNLEKNKETNKLVLGVWDFGTKYMLQIIPTTPTALQ